MVGLRFFDVGALVAWLVWFFRLREDDDDSGGEDDFRGGSEPDAPPPPTGPQGLPLPDAEPWPARRRDHVGDRPPAAPSRRRGAPEREPARVPGNRLA